MRGSYAPATPEAQQQYDLDQASNKRRQYLHEELSALEQNMRGPAQFRGNAPPVGMGQATMDYLQQRHQQIQAELMGMDRPAAAVAAAPSAPSGMPPTSPPPVSPELARALFGSTAEQGTNDPGKPFVYEEPPPPPPPPPPIRAMRLPSGRIVFTNRADLEGDNAGGREVPLESETAKIRQATMQTPVQSTMRDILRSSIATLNTRGGRPGAVGEVGELPFKAQEREIADLGQSAALGEARQRHVLANMTPQEAAQFSARAAGAQAIATNPGIVAAQFMEKQLPIYNELKQTEQDLQAASADPQLTPEARAQAVAALQQKRDALRAELSTRFSGNGLTKGLFP